MPETILLRPDHVPPPHRGSGAGFTRPVLRARGLSLVDNSKPNAETLLRLLGERLAATYRPRDVRALRKSSAGEAITDDLLEAASGSAFAVTAFADCGSCTSWTVRDADQLTRRGVPTAVIVTTPFVGLAITIAGGLGLPTETLIEVPHPVNTLTSDELAHLADQVAPRLSGLLADPEA